MKKKHIFIICSIICAIAIIALFLVFTIKPEQSDDNSNNNPPEQQQTQEEPMFVVPEIINLYLSDTNVEVSANVVFSKNYEIIYFAENTEIIELNGGVICPKQIGSTKVFTKLVYDDKQITKQTQVNVFEDVKSVECKIYKQDEIISQLFIGEKYIVKLQINSPIIGDFSFYANNNISNLILENKNDFEYCYEFVVGWQVVILLRI